ncbi:hypothetical protein EVAR_32752_1 [Eumeta japonica]|uniref:Uncharacterized protein n=1 Tax=Eumeta variegata TaxID=151549 RepID=A0A4C1XPU8_EUMVA|nr:hypothetical protein EVAR_32752_1 [Eumeta japonica]
MKISLKIKFHSQRRRRIVPQFDCLAAGYSPCMDITLHPRSRSDPISIFFHGLDIVDDVDVPRIEPARTPEQSRGQKHPGAVQPQPSSSNFDAASASASTSTAASIKYHAAQQRIDKRLEGVERNGTFSIFTILDPRHKVNVFSGTNESAKEKNAKKQQILDGDDMEKTNRNNHFNLSFHTGTR